MGRRSGNISFFPENASLVLHNVQARDSGRYELESRYTSQTIQVTLHVDGNGSRGSSSAPDGFIDRGHRMNFILVTVLLPAAKVSFTALLLFFMKYFVK